MFLPISDENPRERIPFVNYSLIALNVAAFCVWTAQMADAEYTEWLFGHALIAAHPDFGRMVFAMFLHGDIFHLLGNMLFLWIFGDNIEDRLGHVPYLLCYLIFGFAAWGLHIATSAATPLGIDVSIQQPMACGHDGPLDGRHVPSLGASGAISGVLGAYMVFFPHRRVRTLVLFYIVTLLYVPAWAWIGFWFAGQILYAASDAGGGVAWYAHIGGFVAGAIAAAVARALEAPKLEAVAGWKDVPAELAHASRQSSPRLEPHERAVTVEHTAGVTFVAEPTDRWAVLRLKDDMHAMHKLAGSVSQVTGEAPALVLGRLQSSRGVLARNLSRIDADRIKSGLYRMGVRTLEVPDGPGTRPPAAVLPDDVRWNHEQFDYDGRPVLWRTPFLYLGARVERTSVLDVFVAPDLRLRLTPATEYCEVDRASASTIRRTLHDAANAVVRYRHGAILNDGVRVLAGRGVWGWLHYGTSREYEDYAFWVYNLILSRTPVLRR